MAKDFPEKNEAQEAQRDKLHIPNGTIPELVKMFRDIDYKQPRLTPQSYSEENSDPSYQALRDELDTLRVKVRMIEAKLNSLTPNVTEIQSILRLLVAAVANAHNDSLETSTGMRLHEEEDYFFEREMKEIDASEKKEDVQANEPNDNEGQNTPFLPMLELEKKKEDGPDEQVNQDEKLSNFKI